MQAKRRAPRLVGMLWACAIGLAAVGGRVSAADEGDEGEDRL